MNKNQKTKIGIVGLGYVGLPLAIQFCQACFRVVGVDKDEGKIKDLNKGHSEITDVSSDELNRCLSKDFLELTTSYKELRSVDLISLCVPTPLRKSRNPDMSYVLAAVDQLAEVLTSGQTIVLESTVYPGATEELVLPKLEENGLKLDEDFFLAFSPERVDPGNEKYSIKDIPKVLGGVTPSSTEKAKEIYDEVFSEVHPVDSALEAELAKLLENTYRAVNIGLINELAQVSEDLGANIWNVIEAADTKPFGFDAFYPGPGLGGHCIPIDPLFLSWASRMNGSPSKFIELADEINRGMPQYVVSRIQDILNKHGKAVKGANILLLGVAYKANVADTRESPSFELIEALEDKGAEVGYHDPYVESIEAGGTTLTSQKLNEKKLKEQDLSVIITDHDDMNYEQILKHSKVIFDTRNAIEEVEDGKSLFKL